MKTPEQIAATVQRSMPIMGLDGRGYARYRAALIEAIEADRAQRTPLTGPFGWTDFEEDESTDAIPNKYILTIEEDGEELAVIVHRASSDFPLDGALAERKRQMAQRIVDALNAQVES